MKKPSFEVGEEVYAAWIDEESSDIPWYRGKVDGIIEMPSSGYGKRHKYEILFEDNTSDEVMDQYICSYEDHILLDEVKFLKNTPQVWLVTDGKSQDPWAKQMGWYQMSIDGKLVNFSRLSEAKKAFEEAMGKGSTFGTVAEAKDAARENGLTISTSSD